MYRRKNRFAPLIIFLGLTLLVFIIVSVFRNTNVYIVYKAGLGTFFLISLLMIAIVVLFMKGK
ncbi:hypothetical protein CWS20_15450 [Cytobacillus horneckiae]|uniref:Uncharacterized protein n=1 Tax=Cytobacillus horneckiae TaxID=549687 RepID=A0A2N0ZET0_9BACI|nr:hypothetical protein [Cytobacillus horneckiae]PKG28002.1 hypothetical protein CWS20_15450 [Cytobacillus horneckiae]